MTTLTLIRHARSVHNADGRIQGRTDSPLDDVGRAQAVALAQALADCAFDLLLTSPQSRALETANAIAALHPSLPVRVDDRLREHDAGDFTGLDADQMRARTHSGATDLHVLEWQSPNGEDAVQLRARVQSLLGDIQASHPRDAHLVIVSHGTVLNALLLLALRLPPTSRQVFSFDNASISELAWQDSYWRVRRLNVCPSVAHEGLS
ncbi:MAG: phosphoglycerate mutase [Candidatus Roseilinea sp.]|nr:MAG: phosphoglycerate mutase [Candidatus Roseilinea sp.]